MSNNVTLSLPLSATALRLGATLLTDLAAQADVISREHIIGYAHGAASVSSEGTYLLEKGERVTSQTSNAIEHTEAVAKTEVNVFDPAGALAEAVAVDAAPEPVTQETLPPVQYETVVTGYAPGAVPFAEGHDQVSYEEAGWSIQAMLDAGHLVEVTEKRPLPVAPGASAAPAPAPAPAAPAATGSGVAVDKDGLPWDSRIHSDAAEKLAKTGYWKTKKNLPDGYKLQIEAELKAVMAAGKQTATTTTAAAVAPPAPSAPAAPAPAPAPGVAPAAAATNPFATFTRWILDHKLSATDVVLEVQKLGLTQIPDLGKRTDLIPTVVAALQAKGLGL